VDPAPIKATLRAELRRARRALPPERAAAEAAATVAALEGWLATRDTPVVASYMALPGELDLHALHARRWARGEPVWLPSVSGVRLEWHPVRAVDQLHPGAFGVREADPDEVPAADLPAGAVVVVPGVAFGRDGRRLGQGGGFYDRFLATHAGPTIGVGFTCQRRDDLPLEPHDRPMAGVLLGGTWMRQP
jgi:5-formyltetrahydrofolate cyclo-ligase